MTIFRFSLLLSAIAGSAAVVVAAPPYESFRIDPRGRYSAEFKACSAPDQRKGDLKEWNCYEYEFKRVREQLLSKASLRSIASDAWEKERDRICNEQAKGIPDRFQLFRVVGRCLIDETLRRSAWLDQGSGK